MADYIITNRAGLINKLNKLKKEFNLQQDYNNVGILRDTIQMIEEIIYLNDCLLEDVGEATKKLLEVRGNRVSSMKLLLIEEKEN